MQKTAKIKQKLPNQVQTKNGLKKNSKQTKTN
jgi:hypothetical protein